MKLRSGQIFAALMTKSVNKLNWKNRSRWFSHVNLFLWEFPYLSFSFMETGFSKFQGIIKALPSLDSSSLSKLMRQLRWLDTVFQGQYLPSLNINYVAINKVLEKLPPQLYQIKMKIFYDQGCNDIRVVIATK